MFHWTATLVPDKLSAGALSDTTCRSGCTIDTACADTDVLFPSWTCSYTVSPLSVTTTT